MNASWMQSGLTCLAGATAMLGGCTNMSGLSGSSSYGCKAPEGVTCESVSGTYANALANKLPSQRRPSGITGANERIAAPVGQDPPSRPVPATLSAASTSSIPLRSSARILRLWFKPWEDADRDLYDQGYVYVQVDGGQWLVEHAQRQIREAYAARSRPPPPPPDSAAPGSRPQDARTAAPMPKGSPRMPSPENPAPGLLSPAIRPYTSD